MCHTSNIEVVFRAMPAAVCPRHGVEKSTDHLVMWDHETWDHLVFRSPLVD